MFLQGVALPHRSDQTSPKLQPSCPILAVRMVLAPILRAAPHVEALLRDDGFPSEKEEDLTVGLAHGTILPFSWPTRHFQTCGGLLAMSDLGQDLPVWSPWHQNGRSASVLIPGRPSRSSFSCGMHYDM